jgi:ABC-type glutathione transport system ATPase component
VYSSAKILLLDDIFAALDVHTSRAIMEQCLAGPLLKGRTVLLVTHNIALASPTASYMVVLSPDGAVQSHGAVEKLLKDDVVLHSIEMEERSLTVTGEDTKEQAEQQTMKQKGKQMTKEEMATGHVSWNVCTSFTCLQIRGKMTLFVDKLYFQALGGVIFHLCSLIAIAVQVVCPVLVPAYLAYWSHQYDIHPLEDIPVAK